MFPIRTILHPTDFTEHSKFAFGLACALARDYGATLKILHVAAAPVVPLVNGGIIPVPLDAPKEALMKELNNLRPPDPAIAVERFLAEGDAITEILRCAEDNDADLIVMGTHGRRALARLLMGSVAEAITRRARCPVLTVRTKVAVTRQEPAPREEAVEIC